MSCLKYMVASESYSALSGADVCVVPRSTLLIRCYCRFLQKNIQRLSLDANKSLSSCITFPPALLLFAFKDKKVTCEKRLELPRLRVEAEIQGVDSKNVR